MEAGEQSRIKCKLHKKAPHFSKCGAFFVTEPLKMEMFCILLVAWISSKPVTMLLDYQEEGFS